jgi:hypothetical protein
MSIKIKIEELTGPIWWPAHPEICKGEVKVGDIVTIVATVVDKWGNPVPLEKRKGSQTHVRELQDVRVVGIGETPRFRNPELRRPQLIVERRRPEHVRNVKWVGAGPDQGLETIHIDHTQVLTVKGEAP